MRRRWDGLWEFAEDCSGGVQKLQVRGAVGGDAEDEAVVALGIFQLEDGAAVAGAAEDDTRMVAGMSGDELLEFGGLLIGG